MSLLLLFRRLSSIVVPPSFRVGRRRAAATTQIRKAVPTAGRLATPVIAQRKAVPV